MKGGNGVSEANKVTLQERGVDFPNITANYTAAFPGCQARLNVLLSSQPSPFLRRALPAIELFRSSRNQ